MADDEDDRFLSRWARRKREAAHAERPADEAAAAPDAPLSSPAPLPSPMEDARGEDQPAVAEPPPDLPDPDTMSETEDFTVFLKKEVPDALRRRALRRLWRLNPVFANLDGLNDYDEDYTDAARVVKGLKTLYQAGRGMVLEDDPAPRETRDAAVAVEEGDIDDDTPTEDEAREGEPAIDEPVSSTAEDTAPSSVANAPSAEGPGLDPATVRPTEVAPRARKTAPSNALARRWGRFES